MSLTLSGGLLPLMALALRGRSPEVKRRGQPQFAALSKDAADDRSNQ
jgi:hypothetical protein